MKKYISVLMITVTAVLLIFNIQLVSTAVYTECDFPDCDKTDNLCEKCGICRDCDLEKYGVVHSGDYCTSCLSLEGIVWCGEHFQRGDECGCDNPSPQVSGMPEEECLYCLQTKGICIECGSCADCNYDTLGIVTCRGCYICTDCISQNGNGWCYVCDNCGECCEYGGVHTLPLPPLSVFEENGEVMLRNNTENAVSLKGMYLTYVSPAAIVPPVWVMPSLIIRGGETAAVNDFKRINVFDVTATAVWEISYAA